MNILIHAHEFNIHEGGPCTKRMKSFAECFVKKGHKVTVLTSLHNKSTERKENIDKLGYKVVYSYTTKNTKGSTLKRLINNLLFGITSFFKAFSVGNIDIVITTSPPPFISRFGYFIAKIKRAKLIYDVRDVWPDVAVEMGSFDEKSIYFKVFNFIAKFMYKKSDYVSTVSPRKVEKIKKYCENSDKVWYVPNGFDDGFTKFPQDNEIINKYDLNNNFSVCYIGNVGLAQNLDAMVELAKDNIDNKNVKFLVFGDGAYRAKLQEKIDSMSLDNISLEGKIEYSKVCTILKNSNISFVSLKNTNMLDSIPTKMFDALGVGCPVLLLAKGDSVDILKESKNCGEEAENIDELKKKFKIMIENYKKYKVNCESSMEYYKTHYSREKIAQKFEQKVVKYVK